MHVRAIIAVLLVSILVLGCTSPSTGGNASTPQGQQPGGTAGQNQTQAPPANETSPPAGGNETGGGQPSGGGGNGLAGITFAALMALGVPVQCQITTEAGAVTLYKGAGTDMRTEMSVSGGPCAKVISIVKSDKYYVGCDQGTLFQNCQWLVFSVNATGGGAGSYQKPDYSDIPASQISCVPWIENPSMLQAPGNACDLSALYAQVPG